MKWMNNNNYSFIHSIIRTFSPLDMGWKQMEITRKQPEITKSWWKLQGTQGTDKEEEAERSGN